MSTLKARKEEWKRTYGRYFFIGSCFVLVGVLSFEAGLLWRAAQNKSPLIIRTPSEIRDPQPVEKSALVVAGETNTSRRNSISQESGRSEHCVYVGSKNSNKYHLPTSRCAKQIKAENRVCFSSTEDAQKKGYQPGCLK